MIKSKNLIILLIIIFFSVYYFLRFKINFPLESFSNRLTKIPGILYKTGPFKLEEIPNDIKYSFTKNSEMLGIENKYFDDEKCRRFIKENFSSNNLKSYDMLIPTAFKADYWRYSVLYINGGIYGDISQTFLLPFDVNKSNPDMILVKDRNVCGRKTNIQVSFIATIPKNAFLKYVIDSITIKILRRDKGFCPLDITGPAIFGSLFCKFFNVNEIKEGMNEYRGLDNKKYKILVPFKQLDFRFFSDVNNSSKKMVQIKSKNHLKHIYNNDIKKRYDYQWRNNQIFN